MIKIGTVCSGIGSPEQALKNLGVDHEISFACEIDKYARQTYLANFKPKMMVEDMTKESWEGDEFYSDLFIGGIPCQSFSIAGKRLGELDPRGLLFYDFYRYVKLQQPKVFILENVKGLLSDNKGITFLNWKDLLGSSVNYQEHLFQNPDSLEYNLHFTVLNTKDFGLPQNRERVFLVGIRKDLPNDFSFPSGWELDLRLKDILEDNVDEKYYLSDKIIKGLKAHATRHKGKGNGFKFEPKTKEDIANCLRENAALCPTDNMVIEPYCVAMRGCNPDNASARIPGQNQVQILEKNSQGITNCLSTVQKDNLIIDPRIHGWHENENVIAAHRNDAKRSTVSEHVYHKESGVCTTIQTAHVPKVITHRIRRLTPLECFRLQGFPDSFIKPVSNSQLYKQAGNTISVPGIQEIIKNLLHLLKNKKHVSYR